MKIIVDYDNLVSDWKGAKRADIEYIIDRIIDKIDFVNIANVDALEFKIYGGWFSGRKMTKTALDLSAKIRSSFPKAFEVFLGEHEKKKILARVEITTGLSYRGGLDIYNTRRKRDVSFLKRSKHPSSMGCRKDNCGLEIVWKTLTSGVCPSGNCPAKVDDMVGLEEQKQVDTMMCVDLLEFRGSDVDLVGIVSSDDDLFPAVLRLVDSGVSVLHLSGKTNRNWDFHALGRSAGSYSYINI